jgi:hypothetical protein
LNLPPACLIPRTTRKAVTRVRVLWARGTTPSTTNKCTTTRGPSFLLNGQISMAVGKTANSTVKSSYNTHAKRSWTQSRPSGAGRAYMSVPPATAW